MAVKDTTLTPAQMAGQLDAPAQKLKVSGDVRLLTRVGLLVLFLLGLILLYGPKATNGFLFATTIGVCGLAMWLGPLALIPPAPIGRQLVDPLTLLSTATIYYVLKGIPIAWGEPSRITAQFTGFELERSYLKVLLLVGVGLACLFIGYRFGITLKQPQGGQQKPTPAQPRVFMFAALTILSLISLVGVLRTLDFDVLALIKDPFKRTYLSESGVETGFGGVFFALLEIFGVLIVAGLSCARPRSTKAILFWVGAGALVLGVYFLLKSRAQFLGVVIACMFVVHYKIRRINFKLMTAFLVGAILYAYTVSEWRYVSGMSPEADLGTRVAGLAENVSFEDFGDFILGSDLSDIHTFVLIENTYGVLTEYHYGGTLLRIVTQLIPRAFWPDKPYDLGVELEQLWRPGSASGIPPGLFGEMYMNFGSIGVVFGSLLCGLLAALLFRKLVLSGSHIGLVIYAVILPRILLAPSATLANGIFFAVLLVAGVLALLRPQRATT
ncbi:MAG TPA: O-antigen polymerase [Methylomirabilota bacterium]|nr:O-antigen polymerase [Methylomirabilota bacterium]